MTFRFSGLPLVLGLLFPLGGCNAPAAPDNRQAAAYPSYVGQSAGAPGDQQNPPSAEYSSDSGQGVGAPNNQQDASAVSSPTGFGQDAGAQGFSIVGAWTAEAPGQGGMQRFTSGFNPDGTYVEAHQLPNGTIERDWGTYSVSMRSPTQVHLDVRRQDWAPHQLCSQAPGFPMRCSDYNPPANPSADLTVTSASSIEAGGVRWVRDGSPYLLSQQVPERVFMQAQAPVQPYIRQPVMPTLHPYQTPNGPGNAIANANHANARDFIDLRMRGCYKNASGQLYGCKQ